jgi:hypothetical protein
VQRSRFRTLRTLANEKADDKTKQQEALYKLAYEFPKEETSLAATSLGNALANVGSYTWNQYGVHLDTMWPAMTSTLKTKDAELSARLGNSRTALEFLASLALLIGLVAAELLFLPLFCGQPRWAWVGTAVLLGASYLCYRTCVRKAVDWGREVRAAFDQHLDELATALDMAELKGRLKKEQWQAASRWLLYGAADLQTLGFDQPTADKTWYETPKPGEAQEPSVIAPATVTVQKHHRVLQEFAIDKTGDTSRRIAGLEIDYVFIVTNEQSGEHAQTAAGVSMLISDPRLPVVPSLVDGELREGPPHNPQVAKVKGQRQPGGPQARDALLWQVGDIPPRGTIVLRYKVAYEQTLQLERRAGYVSQAIVDVSLEDGRHMVLVKNTAGEPRTCRLVADGFKRYQLPRQAGCYPPSHWVDTEFPNAEQGTWTVESLAPNETLSFSIRLP